MPDKELAEPDTPASRPPPLTTWWHRAIAYSVHCYTALGLLCSVFITHAILRDDHAVAFLWMLIGVAIDASDGPLARRLHIRESLPEIDGRRLDDLVDYLNYTFLPVLLIGHAGWLPEPVWCWMTVPLIASALAFANSSAKQEDSGFFLGFPSYWNVVAFYVATWLHTWGSPVVLAVVLTCSILSVLPLRFIYPTQAPRWRTAILIGSLIWTATFYPLLRALWNNQPPAPVWIGISLVYPALYIGASVYLDIASRGGRTKV